MSGCSRIPSGAKCLIFSIFLSIVIMTLLLSIRQYHLTESNWTYCDYVIWDVQDKIGTDFCFDIFDKSHIDEIPEECQLRCKNYRILSIFAYTFIILNVSYVFKSCICLLPFVNSASPNESRERLLGGNHQIDIKTTVNIQK